MLGLWLRVRGRVGVRVRDRLVGLRRPLGEGPCADLVGLKVRVKVRAMVRVRVKG